jgi:hypothetical protein
MACYNPIEGYYSKYVNPTGKRSIVFKWQDALNPTDPIKVPCGQCIGCRLERSRQWAIRCAHEAQMHEDNCFITLTYNPKYLPWDRSLKLRHFQLFMKKLRKKYTPKNPYDRKEQKDEYEEFRKKHAIRFFHCGEYGEKFGRPHYHACIFNFDFPDKKFWKKTNTGELLFTSEALEKLWSDPNTGENLGFCSIGSVTFHSAAYVARYITKKVTGKNAEKPYKSFGLKHYEFINPHTGEIVEKVPEYVTMSRNPGIGKGWYDKFKNDVYPHDYVVMNGEKMRPPKYYDGLYEIEYPEDLEKIKEKRVENGEKHAHNNTHQRLKTRERCQLAKFKMLKREL